MSASVPAWVLIAACCVAAWAGRAEAQDRPAVTFLPGGDVFAPLVADPREPRLHLSVVATRGFFETTLWLADHGESIGIVRWASARRAVQVGLLVNKLAQIDLEARSNALVNTDFSIGVPVTVRQGAVSARLQVFHTSSHLGDEYLVQTGTVPQNISFEQVDLVISGEPVSVERAAWRLYGGGNYAFRRSSASPEPGAVQLGAEVRSRPLVLRRAARGRLVAAADGRFTRERAWEPTLSVRAGIELGTGSGGAARTLSLLGEFFTGPIAFGQLYRENLTFAGAALQVSL